MIIGAAISVLTGCASSGSGRRPAGSSSDGARSQTQGPGQIDPSRLLRQARERQAKEGCAKAVPSYRIVSAFGEDYEIAQYELGACLLSMTGRSEAETKLFRHEAVLWLSRAAWSGNPRAQGKLAEILSGAPHYSIDRISPDPLEAMTWSIIYDANGSRAVFGLDVTPKFVLQHLQSALSPEQAAKAAEKASAFQKITMEAFVPGAEYSENARGTRSSDAPQGGRRRPRQ